MAKSNNDIVLEAALTTKEQAEQSGEPLVTFYAGSELSETNDVLSQAFSAWATVTVSSETQQIDGQDVRVLTLNGLNSVQPEAQNAILAKVREQQVYTLQTGFEGETIAAIDTDNDDLARSSLAKYQAVGTHFNHIAFSGSPSYETLNTTAAADRASLGILTDTYNATLQGMETQSFGQIFGGMYGKGEASERLSAMNGKIIKAVEPAVTKANGRADIDVDAFKQRMMQFRAEKDVEARPEGKEAIQSVNKQQITLKAAEEDVKAHPERQGAMEAIQSANAGWDKKKAESAKGEEAQKEKPKSKSLFSSIGRLFRKIGEVVGLVKPKEISVPYDAAHDVSAGDKLRDMDKLRDQGKKLQPLCGQLQEIEEIRNLNEILKQSGLPKIADDQKLKDISTALRNNIKKEAHYDRSTNYKQMDEESQVKKLEARQDKGASQQMGG